MQYNLKACLDNTGYKEKPAGGEIGKINNRMGKNVEELKNPESIKKFVYDVAFNGKHSAPLPLGTALGTQKILNSCSY